MDCFDGEIKGPGPFGSMCLVVLKNFRDLTTRSGPAFRFSSNGFNSLSGTSRTVGMGSRRDHLDAPGRASS
jgi:hypothetical protein